ncbi:hypothetical protein ERJ75_001111800 [Trypanosoma vivax]|nr:hypothetical protein ERJ75_001111800 [Trypanosoma vivax]
MPFLLATRLRFCSPVRTQRLSPACEANPRLRPAGFRGPCSDTRNGPLAVALGWQRCAAACVPLSSSSHTQRRSGAVRALPAAKASDVVCFAPGAAGETRLRPPLPHGRVSEPRRFAAPPARSAPTGVHGRLREGSPSALDSASTERARAAFEHACWPAMPTGPSLSLPTLHARARSGSILSQAPCSRRELERKHACRRCPPRRRVRQTHAGSPTACVTWQVRWRRPRRCVRSACPTHQRTLQVSLGDRHRARLSRGPVAHLGAPVLPAAAVGRAPGVRHTRHLKHTPLLERAARARPSRVPEPGGQRWRRAGGSRVSLTQRPCEPPSGVHAVRAAQRRERADPRPAHHRRRSTSCSRAVGAVRLGSGVSGRGRRHG